MGIHPLAAVFSMALAGAGGVGFAADAPVTVKVIAFNDFHGSLLAGTATPTPGGAPIAVGGIDYMAAYVAQLESENPNHAVVSAGDLVGATPLISSFYHDEPTIEAMNLLGLDASAVGNHEFDAGPVEILRKQNGGCFPGGLHTCLSERTFHGAKFRYLAANVTYSASGSTLFPAYLVKYFQGVPVAFVGVGLTSTPTIVTPQGVAGLTFNDEADTVNRLIPELQARGIHAVIVLIHQGGTQRTAARPEVMNDCADLLGGAQFSPIVGIVSRLDDAVDLVISGHTHKAYNCRLPNRAGRLIPVTQAGYYGQVLTDIDLTLDESGRITHIASANRLVSHPAADAPDSPVHPYLASPAVEQIRVLMADYAAAVAPLANQVIGSIAAPLTNVPGANGEEPAGDLIADSELAATASGTHGGAVIAFVNGGGVRSPGFDVSRATYPHDVTYQEAFAVRPFGNSLVTMSLTAADLKDLLEQQFAGCHGQTANRLLQVSNGLHVDWSGSAAVCRKVVNVTLKTPFRGARIDRIVERGEVRHPRRRYRITIDNYLASGGDGFSVFARGTHLIGGPQDIDALAAYFSSVHLSPRAPYDPTDPRWHIPRETRLP